MAQSRWSGHWTSTRQRDQRDRHPGDRKSGFAEGVKLLTAIHFVSDDAPSVPIFASLTSIMNPSGTGECSSNRQRQC